jgi:hypothetical protein
MEFHHKTGYRQCPSVGPAVKWERDRSAGWPSISHTLSPQFEAKNATDAGDFGFFTVFSEN